MIIVANDGSETSLFALCRGSEAHRERNAARCRQRDRHRPQRARIPAAADAERQAHSHGVSRTMGQMLVVTLREGIEMFLIVAIAAAYLRKTGRTLLLPAVWWGAGVAAVASLVLGVWLAEVAVLPFRQGVLALVAAALV